MYLFITRGKPTYTVIPISDEELENLTAKEKVLLNK